MWAHSHSFRDDKSGCKAHVTRLVSYGQFGSFQKGQGLIGISAISDISDPHRRGSVHIASLLWQQKHRNSGPTLNGQHSKGRETFTCSLVAPSGLQFIVPRHLQRHTARHKTNGNMIPDKGMDKNIDIGSLEPRSDHSKSLQGTPDEQIKVDMEGFQIN